MAARIKGTTDGVLQLVMVIKIAPTGNPAFGHLQWCYPPHNREKPTLLILEQAAVFYRG
jgi:hypothetical protein